MKRTTSLTIIAIGGCCVAAIAAVVIGLLMDAHAPAPVEGVKEPGRDAPELKVVADSDIERAAQLAGKPQRSKAG